MASGGGDELVESFKKFCQLAGAKDTSQMTSKANGKLVTDCFVKEFKQYDVKAICDASVFPACKEKGSPHMIVNKANVDKYITKTAHEIAKKKHKEPKMAESDEKVKAVKEKLCSCVTSAGGPKVKEVKISATGNVSGMTDTSKYTASHKGRFDESGKGVGKKGRVDEVDTSGYVGNYKGAGTYGKK